jgi:hypothetical protein
MRFLGWIFVLLLLPLVVAALFLLAAVEQSPLVDRSPTISQTSIAQARRLLASNDPRRLRRGDERSDVIPAALIDDAINHLASRSLRGRGAFVLTAEGGEIRLTVPLPVLPGPRYLNLSALLAPTEDQPRIARAAIGSFAVPSWLAEHFVAAAIGGTGLADEWHIARQAVRRLSFEPERGTVVVRYVWEPDLLDQARALAFPPADIARFQAAQRALAGLLAPYSARTPVSLSQVLPPLLTCCGEGAAEGRAALLVLATHLAGRNLAEVLPQARRWPRPRPVRLTLLDRHDTAQHFGVSAALAAWSGEPAANALGLFKELQDARAGSGFSFADLAADRAGTRFGELVAAGSPRLQQALRARLSEADLAPSLDGLPENLPEAEFARRYADGDNAAYRQLTREIEDRLAALPLYR